MTQGQFNFQPGRVTRFDIVRNILLEKLAAGEKGFDLRRLAEQVEQRFGKWTLEDTIRKEADMLKTEIPFVRAGKGIRKFLKGGEDE